MPTVKEWREFRHGKRPEITAAQATENLWEFGRDFVPYMKYFDADERERFRGLSQQKQTRELLYENMNLLILMGGGRIIKGVAQPIRALGSRYVSPTFRKWFPKATANLEKVAETTTQKVVTSEPLPKYAGSVNLERQAIARDLKLAELRVSEGIPRKTVTLAETDIKSAAIMQHPKKVESVLEKARTGQALNRVEDDVVRKANVEGVFKYQQDMLLAKTPAEEQALFRRYTNEIFRPADTIAGERGRMLQAYSKEIGLNRVGKAFSKLGRSLNPREAKAFKDLDLTDAGAVNRFAKNLGDPKLMDYVYEYWYNNILSGVPTHVVNVASNTAWRQFQIPHRGLTGGIDLMIAKFKGRPQERFIREMVPLWGGMIKGKGKAAKSAWQMAARGQLSKFETKWAQEMGSSLGAFARSGNKAVRGAGHAITVPTKALRAMDVYANSLAYDGQMAALAHRKAIQLGLRGAEKKAFIRKFKLNPTDKAHNEAMEFAKYTTFMSDPGKISSWIMKGRGVVPGGRFVVPFVNTIGNLLKRGVEMTPGVGLTMSRGQKPAEVIAKQIEGSIIGMTVLNKLDEGKMTGAAPIEKAKREAFYRQGKKAWAIQVGDNWYQYRRAEPYNTILASAHITHQRVNEALKGGDSKAATDAMGNMVSDFKNNLIDSSYLQGVTKVLNRHGTAESILPQLTASMVPYSSFWRSINRAYEAHEEGSAKVYEHGDWLASFGQVIPGLYKLREPKLTVWGEEVTLPGGVLAQWLPYKFSPATKDKTELYLEKLEKYPGIPSQVVTHKGSSFRLDDDIYRQMSVDAGRKIKSWLDSKVDQKVWKNRLKTEGGKERAVSIIDSKRHKILYQARRKAIKAQISRGVIRD